MMLSKRLVLCCWCWHKVLKSGIKQAKLLNSILLSKHFNGIVTVKKKKIKREYQQQQQQQQKVFIDLINSSVNIIIVHLILWYVVVILLSFFKRKSQFYYCKFLPIKLSQLYKCKKKKKNEPYCHLEMSLSSPYNRFDCIKKS